MDIDGKLIIPNKSLIRYGSYKERTKRRLPSVNFNVKKEKYHYKVYYKARILNTFDKEISVRIPSKINFDSKLQAAIIAYICEGDTPIRANGVRLGFNNSDWRLVKLVVDQLEKIGLEKIRWNVRLELYKNEHDLKREIDWWSKKISIPKKSFSNPNWYQSKPDKKGFHLHGRARIQRSSVIWTAIIDYVSKKVINGLISKQIGAPWCSGQIA